MTAPTVEALVKSIEDYQATLLPGQKSGDKLTLHYLANLTVAAEIRACYLQLESGLSDIDLLKATGTKLEAIVSHVLQDGRLLGDYATGSITFRAAYPATSEIIIPAGSKVYAITEDNTKLYFETTVEGSIVEGESDIAIAARASERGPGGNIGPYEIVSMVARITGITSVENSLDFLGGTEDETDGELRERYFDAIQAPGKATAMMLERAINDVTTVSEVQIVSYGEGDLGVLVDHSGGITDVSHEIVDAISENIAAGIQARGCLGAIIDGSQVIVLNDDVYGGQVWVRPRCFVAGGDAFSLTYLDMAAVSKTAGVTIPAGTHRGEMIAATLDSEASRAKKILTVTPSGDNSYDVLLGMGEAGMLYNLPELITVGIAARIKLTATPEAGLVALIEASEKAFLGAYRIGESLEYSDVVRFFQNQYDLAADEFIGRPLKGVDELIELIVSGGGQLAVKNGDKITVEEDWRIEAGEVDITVES
ncbi:MAG: baseplate J/gp47 family protein [Methanothrix sp.]